MLCQYHVSPKLSHMPHLVTCSAHKSLDENIQFDFQYGNIHMSSKCSSLIVSNLLIYFPRSSADARFFSRIKELIYKTSRLDGWIVSFRRAVFLGGFYCTYRRIDIKMPRASSHRPLCYLWIGIY